MACSLFQQAIIVGVAADPEPDAVVVPPDAKRAVVEADTRRPKAADPLEAKRRMLWIGLQQGEILVGDAPDLRLEPLVVRPEGGGGAVDQRGRVRPASKSASASSASRSSLPASTSFSSCPSQRCHW